MLRKYFFQMMNECDGGANDRDESEGGRGHYLNYGCDAKRGRGYAYVRFCRVLH